MHGWDDCFQAEAEKLEYRRENGEMVIDRTVDILRLHAHHEINVVDPADGPPDSYVYGMLARSLGEQCQAHMETTVQPFDRDSQSRGYVKRFSASIKILKY